MNHDHMIHSADTVHSNLMTFRSIKSFKIAPKLISHHFSIPNNYIHHQFLQLTTVSCARRPPTLSSRLANIKITLLLQSPTLSEMAQRRHDDLQSVGTWRVVQRLGEGSFGSVYCVTKKKKGQKASSLR